MFYSFELSTWLNIFFLRLLIFWKGSTYKILNGQKVKMFWVKTFEDRFFHFYFSSFLFPFSFFVFCFSFFVFPFSFFVFHFSFFIVRFTFFFQFSFFWVWHKSVKLKTPAWPPWVHPGSRSKVFGLRTPRTVGRLNFGGEA